MTWEEELDQAYFEADRWGYSSNDCSRWPLVTVAIGALTLSFRAVYLSGKRKGNQ